MENIEWKRIMIDGKETNYWICQFGRVINEKTGKFLSIAAGPYPKVVLYINGVRYNKSCDKLVNQCFNKKAPWATVTRLIQDVSNDELRKNFFNGRAQF